MTYPCWNIPVQFSKYWMKPVGAFSAERTCRYMTLSESNTLWSPHFRYFVCGSGNISYHTYLSEDK